MPVHSRRQSILKGLGKAKHMRRRREVPAGERPRISACIIAKDEARCIGRCLDSIKDYVTEIIVVDTGSTDDTVAIAESKGAKVHHFPWQDSFALARNEALKHATCEWVLVIDCDETLLPGSGEALIRLLQKQKEQVGLRPVIHSKKGVFLLSARVFRREGVEYRYRLHEQPTFEGKQVAAIEAPQVNLGHDGDVVEIRDQFGKIARNLRIAKLDLEDNPEDPHAMLNHAWSLHEEDVRSVEAIRIIEEVRQKFNMKSEHTTYLLLKGYRAQGNEEAAQRALVETLEFGCRHRYFLFERAKYFVSKDEYAQAVPLLDEAMSMPEENGGHPQELSFMITGLRGVAREGVLDLKGAQADYELARRSKPNDARILDGLSRVSKKMKILADARG